MIPRENNNNPERLSFLSKEKDAESNLGDFGVRKYDDLTGRFTAIDPLWEKYYGWSPYNYTGNNPINRTDVTGLNWYSNDNGDIKWFDRTGHFSDENSGDWFDNGENYPFPQETGALEDNSSDFIGGLGRKVGSLLSKALNISDIGSGESESGLNEFTQENVNQIVVNSKKKYGGNITVMKDGKPVFRVHQPGSHENENATIDVFKLNTNSSNGKTSTSTINKNFDDHNMKILLKGLYGIDGYSVKTKGRR